MSEEDPNDSKVVQLFAPGSTDARGESGQQSEPQRPKAASGRGSIRQEVTKLMGALEPLDPPNGDSLAPPDGAHRNAMPCPQCDRITWRHTRHCLHCGADLVVYVRLQAQQRRARLEAIFWSCAAVSWVIAVTCFELATRGNLRPKLRTALYFVGGAIVAVNLFGFWIATQNERR